MKSQKCIVIACGGTGGHLFPGIAVAEQLRDQGHKVVLLVSPKQVDALALEGHKNFESYSLPAIGWPGFSPRLVQFTIKMMQSRTLCENLFSELKADAVLGMGGFTCVMPLWVAHSMKIPALLHESNSIPGRVTKLFRKRVKRVLLGFEACSKHLPGATCVKTGTPVRASLKRLDRQEAASRLGLDPSFKTILIMGGSQGARGINQIILNTLPLWTDRAKNWQFIHLTGGAEQNIVEINYRRQEMKSYVRPFLQDMAAALSLADVAVSRSGASSLSEISVYGIPSILIPFPAAVEDHQTRNAEIFVKAGAAVMMPQEKLQPIQLHQEVIRILDDSEYASRMGQAASRINGDNAARVVAQEVEKCLTA